jgi:hypothetical protein
MRRERLLTPTLGYREENGQVILTMSREDYERLLMVMGMGMGAALMGRGGLPPRVIIPLLNRLNLGNPHYTPYKLESQ